MRDAGAIRVKAVYGALGIRRTGEKGLLGLRIASPRTPCFGWKSKPKSKTRGCGVSAFQGVVPKTAMQLCVVLMVRYSLNYVKGKL
jgi:putative transposase